MTNQLRYITRAILAAILMLSCSENIIPEEQEYAISMTATSTDMSTSRALITDIGKLQSTELGVGVYAYKEVNSIETLVFDNTKLTYDNTKGWDYSPKRYWDRTATYNFVAYAPYSSESAKTVYVPENNTLTINNIPYWQTINGSETDYLVANSRGSADYYLTQQQTSTAVNFNFSHILSQLVINVVKDANLTNTEYKVKKIEYINVPASEGNANCTYSSPSSTPSSPSSTPSFSDITITSSSSNPSSVSKYTSIDGTIPPINLPHLVVPFTLSDKKVQVKVTYTVEGTPRTKTVDTGITQLEAGKRYELTLTFKGADIVPSLRIEPWTDVPVDEDPKYNW